MQTEHPEQGKTTRPTKGEITRKKLMTHACSEFARLGYHGTKVSDIVKASGLSQPTFYIYFASKEAAYEELVAEFRQRLEKITKDLLIRTPMAGDVLVKSLQKSFMSFLGFLAEDRELTEIGFFQPPGCTVTKEHLVDWIAENIAQEQTLGVFRQDIDTEIIARCFVGMIDQMARVPPGKASLSELALGASCILCEGIWMNSQHA